MARTKTQSKSGPLVSPFSYADEDAARVAYNNMPHAKREGYKPPTKAQWRKKYAEGRAKWLEQNASKAASKSEASGNAPAQASNNVEVLRTLAENGAAPEVIAATAKALGLTQQSEPVDPRVQALIDAGIDEEQAYQIIGIDQPSDSTTQGASSYRARKGKNEVPTDAARNAVLWALNTEGLLSEALDSANEGGLDYITQECGQSILSAHFGPLPANQQ